MDDRAPFLSEITPTLEPQTCPCCHQRVQLYKRTVTTAMVESLALLAKQTERVKYLLAEGDTLPEGLFTDWLGGIWVHCGHMKTHTGTGDYAKLRFFELATPADARTRKENSAGFWQITETGIRFLAGLHTIPKYAFVYNNEVVEYASEKVSVYDVRRFSYEETTSAED